MIRLRLAAAASGAALILANPWTAQHSGTTAEFRGLSVVSDKVVWASGTRGTVVRTADGGATWVVDTIPGAARLDFRDIEATDENTAFAMSAGPAEQGQAKIFATHNGGKSWKEVYTSDTKGIFLDAISFWDKQHGIAMSDPIDGKPYLIRTDDGGATWTAIPSSGFPATLPNEGGFAASGTALIVFGKTDVWIATGGAERARVFRSKDRGTTWEVADTPVHSGDGGKSGAFSVAFADAMHGVVVGGNYSQARGLSDNVALSSDGGATWRLPTGVKPAGFMSGVAYVPGSKGKRLIAIGLGGTAESSDGGESWSMVDSLGYNSVALSSKGTAWAAGPRGRIAVWDGASKLNPR